MQPQTCIHTATATVHIHTATATVNVHTATATVHIHTATATVHIHTATATVRIHTATATVHISGLSPGLRLNPPLPALPEVWTPHQRPANKRLLLLLQCPSKHSRALPEECVDATPTPACVLLTHPVANPVRIKRIAAVFVLATTAGRPAAGAASAGTDSSGAAAAGLSDRRTAVVATVVDMVVVPHVRHHARRIATGGHVAGRRLACRGLLPLWMRRHN
eukprot:356399-Chlamydomonas_euryale.AAC.1